MIAVSLKRPWSLGVVTLAFGVEYVTGVLALPSTSARLARVARVMRPVVSSLEGGAGRRMLFTGLFSMPFSFLGVASSSSSSNSIGRLPRSPFAAPTCRLFRPRNLAFLGVKLWIMSFRLAVASFSGSARSLSSSLSSTRGSSKRTPLDFCGVNWEAVSPIEPRRSSFSATLGDPRPG